MLVIINKRLSMSQYCRCTLALNVSRTVQC